MGAEECQKSHLRPPPSNLQLRDPFRAYFDGATTQPWSLVTGLGALISNATVVRLGEGGRLRIRL
jgi:hypothetical protein